MGIITMKKLITLTSLLALIINTQSLAMATKDLNATKEKEANSHVDKSTKDLNATKKKEANSYGYTTTKELDAYADGYGAGYNVGYSDAYNDMNSSSVPTGDCIVNGKKEVLKTQMYCIGKDGKWINTTKK